MGSINRRISKSLAGTKRGIRTTERRMLGDRLHTAMRDESKMLSVLPEPDPIPDPITYDYFDAYDDCTCELCCPEWHELPV